MDEKYLELLAEYAARQIAVQQVKRKNAPKIERAAHVRHARRVRTLTKNVQRSFTFKEAYKHALLLALGGRSTAKLTAAE